MFDLSPSSCRRTSGAMPPHLFDMVLRAKRRDRAFRIGAETFIFERAFGDILDRLAHIHRRFDSALLVGCPDATWPVRLRTAAEHVSATDPGLLFAEAAGGSITVEDQADFGEGAFDLVVAVGTLDTVNDLPAALQAIARSMRANALLIGAVTGGNTLPGLRMAMRAADQVTGLASAHVHPRIEAGAMAGLLTSAGFAMPVVDVDRLDVSYPSLSRLISDLRAMGATNILADRSRLPLGRAAFVAASQAFAAAGDGRRTLEHFELLHFASWTPAR